MPIGNQFWFLGRELGSTLGFGSIFFSFSLPPRRWLSIIPFEQNEKNIREQKGLMDINGTQEMYVNKVKMIPTAQTN